MTRASEALKKYHRRRAQGLCVQCGVVPPMEGVTRCGGCREKRKVVSAAQKTNRHEGYCRQCLTKKADEGVTSCKQCRDRAKAKSKRKVKETRAAVIEMYGGACVCCGLRNPKYLELDHKNDDGNEERKQLGSSGCGSRFFVLVLRQPRRGDLQLLCYFCHKVKTLSGGCTPEDHFALREHWVNWNGN